MKIQVNTDSNISGHEALGDHVRGTVESILSNFSDRITRVEVHLSDENGGKTTTDDKRCMMEARLENRQPLVVSHLAATLGQAIDGAAEKMNKLVGSTLDRQRDETRRRTDPLQPGMEPAEEKAAENQG